MDLSYSFKIGNKKKKMVNAPQAEMRDREKESTWCEY